MERIALIGAGAIGRAWAIVFARAGHRVTLQSRTEETLAIARDFISVSLQSLREFGLLDEQPELVVERIQFHTDLQSRQRAFNGATGA